MVRGYLWHPTVGMVEKLSNEENEEYVNEGMLSEM